MTQLEIGGRLGGDWGGRLGWEIGGRLVGDWWEIGGRFGGRLGGDWGEIGGRDGMSCTFFFVIFGIIFFWCKTNFLRTAGNLNLVGAQTGEPGFECQSNLRF